MRKVISLTFLVMLILSLNSLASADWKEKRTEDGIWIIYNTEVDDTFSVEELTLKGETFYKFNLGDKAFEQIYPGNFEGVATIHFTESVDNCYGVIFKYRLDARNPEIFTDADWYLGIINSEEQYITTCLVSDNPKFDVCDISSMGNTDSMMDLNILAAGAMNDMTQILITPDVSQLPITPSADDGFYFGFQYDGFGLYFKSKESIYEYLQKIYKEPITVEREDQTDSAENAADGDPKT